MTSREKILVAVAEKKPAFEALPVLDFAAVTRYDDDCEQFAKALTACGGEVIWLESRKRLAEDMEKEKAAGALIMNMLNGDDSQKVMSANAADLEPVYKCYLKSYLGVAENGAVWLRGSDLVNPLLPFISQHVVVVLDPQNIVPTMHEAYRQIYQNGGYGVFIAGPSKTADIEQSLVIGAHGAKSMTIYLIDEKHS